MDPTPHKPASLHYHVEEYGLPAEAYCFDRFGQLPSRLEVTSLHRRLLKDLEADARLHRVFSRRDILKKRVRVREALYEYGNLVLVVEDDTFFAAVRIFFREHDAAEADALAHHLLTYRKRQAQKARIGIVRRDFNNLEVTQMDFPRRRLDLRLYYGQAFAAKYPALLEILLNRKRTGLILFYGPPGTGKTMLLRHLITALPRKEFLLLPPDMARTLQSPDTVSFLYHHPNAVLIIEDAEPVLQPRDRHDSSAVSGMLNFTDGLQAELLNLKIICTLNQPLHVLDPALTRKGRLLFAHQFGPLAEADAKAVADKHKCTLQKTGPHTLAEILHGDEHNANWEDKPKIGLMG